MAQQILKFLLLVYTFLLPLQTRYFLLDSSVEYQRISIYGTQILFLLILILYFIHFSIRHSNESWNPEKQNKQKKPPIFSFPRSGRGRRLDSMSKHGMTVFFLFILFVVIQMIVSTRVDLTIQALLWIFQVVLFVWIVRRERLERMVLWTFLASMAFQSFVIWVQFFTQYIPSSKWLGVAEHISSVGGVSVIETFDSRWLRGYGIFPHPNIAGGFLLIAIIAMSKLQITNHKFQTNSNNQNSSHYSLLTTHYLLLGLLVSSLMLTFSRSALLGFIIFILMGFFIHFFRRPPFSTPIEDPETQNKQKKNPFGFFFSFPRSGRGRRLDSRRSLPRTEFTPYFDTGIRGGNDVGGWYLKFILISAVFLLVMTVPLRDLIFSRTNTSSRLETISASERIEYNQYGREVIKNNLWLGVGLGNYSSALQKIHPDLKPYRTQPPHSVPLLVLSEIGILGALLLLAILIRLSLLTTHNSLLTIFIPLLPLLLFDHYLWSLYAGWGVIALAGVLGEHLRIPEGER